MAVQKPSSKKAPAKKAPAKKVPTPPAKGMVRKEITPEMRTDMAKARIAAKKTADAKKKTTDQLAREDFYKAHGKRRAGKGMAAMAAKPGKKDFYDTTLGKAVIASSPVLSAVVGISAVERAVRKKIKGNKAYGDPTPKFGK